MIWRGRTWKRSGTIHTSKETHIYVKRDPHINQNRPYGIAWTHMKVIYICFRRDPQTCQKRPMYMSNILWHICASPFKYMLGFFDLCVLPGCSLLIHAHLFWNVQKRYGVATISRLLKSICLFCRI